MPATMPQGPLSSAAAGPVSTPPDPLAGPAPGTAPPGDAPAGSSSGAGRRPVSIGRKDRFILPAPVHQITMTISANVAGIYQYKQYIFVDNVFKDRRIRLLLNAWLIALG